ncbi:MAG: hypothetical protein O3C10_03060 [Chloroflexi bacterium]|nr:hypothetical protein [Chloroflexota bacterium]
MAISETGSATQDDEISVARSDTIGVDWYRPEGGYHSAPAKRLHVRCRAPEEGRSAIKLSLEMEIATIQAS